MRRVRCAGRSSVPLGHGALPVIGGARMFGPETNGMWQSRILMADKATCSVASIASWRAKSGSWKASMTDYIELHARSAFSFLEGASTPEELIGACSELKMPAMALLDRDGVYGAARFHLAAKKIRIKAHIGAEVSVQSLDCRLQIADLKAPGEIRNLKSEICNSSRFPLLISSRI